MGGEVQEAVARLIGSVRRFQYAGRYHLSTLHAEETRDLAPITGTPRSKWNGGRHRPEFDCCAEHPSSLPQTIPIIDSGFQPYQTTMAIWLTRCRKRGRRDKIWHRIRDPRAQGYSTDVLHTVASPRALSSRDRRPQLPVQRTTQVWRRLSNGRMSPLAQPRAYGTLTPRASR